jgi:hypothetical protein
MDSPKRVRSRLKEQMTPKGKRRDRCHTQARDSEDLDRLSIISGELVPHQSGFDKPNKATWERPSVYHDLSDGVLAGTPFGRLVSYAKITKMLTK